MYSNYGKRFFDLIVSGVLIVFTSWLFLLIFIVYLITFNLPVFFSQARMGRGEKVFKMIKFRSLNDSKEPFALGTFLRFTSMDELPQLFQVWSGKMSLIGPRPLPVEYQNLFSAEQRRRHNVLPGITGWAQVNGRHAISWEKKLELDNYYVDHISFAMDFRILIKTVGVLLSFRKDKSLEEQKFTGNSR